MSLVAVDLAAKFSAACWMSDQRVVLSEWDSWQVSESTFIDRITMPWESSTAQRPQALVVEDLPHRLTFDSTVRAVCRLQGRIVERMMAFGAGGEVIFVPPVEWRKFYPELRKRGSGPQAVVPVAAEHDYKPPDLTHRFRGERGEKAVARKVQTDYCAAFLIGWWAVSSWYQYGTLDLPGTSRYGQPAIPPKESLGAKS